MNNGFIQLHRQMLEWEWYDDLNTFKIFIHCLFKANYKSKIWRGVKIPVGSFITSYGNLAKETGLSTQNVRTSLSKLKSTSELTIKTSNKYTIIQVVSYKNYQGLTSKLTNNQQTTNKQLTTTNKDNNINNIYIQDFEEFWKYYPKKRASSKDKALQSYKKVLKEKRCNEVKLLEVVKDYAKSDEVKKGFAKGCSAWLNDDRFNNIYTPTKENNYPDASDIIRKLGEK